MFYKTIVGILRVLIKGVFRVRVIGAENMPKEGGAIVASNHRSNWDPIVVAITTPRKLTFMAKAELFKNKMVASVLRAVGAFPIKRGGGDVGAIKGALTILKNEDAMLIFPEGTRVADESKSEAKPGTVMLAIRAKVPVVPVYTTGKYRWFSKITVTFGKPVYYEEFYGEKLSVEELQKLSNELLATMRSYKYIEKEGAKQ